MQSLNLTDLLKYISNLMGSGLLSFFVVFFLHPSKLFLVAQRKDFFVVIWCGMIQTFLDVLGILTHLLTDCFIIFGCAHWLCCLAIDSHDLLQTLVLRKGLSSPFVNFLMNSH